MTTIKQLFEILQKYNRVDLLDIHHKVALEKGKVVINTAYDLTEDTKIKFEYFFFHHCNEAFPASTALKAIEEKDFVAFSEIYNKWEYVHNLVYLPDSLFIVDEATDEIIGTVSGMWIKDIFELVDFAEYECG